MDLRRGRLTLLEYLTEHAYTLNEAMMLGGFDMNNQGKSWYLLKHSGLDRARQDQLLLMISQDLTRYEELKTHIERLAKAAQPNHIPGPGGYYGEEEWPSNDWNDAEYAY